MARSDTAELLPPVVIRTALLVAALVVLALLAWQLSDVFLIGFAAVLFAIVLRSIAGQIERRTPLKERLSLAISILLIVIIAAAFVYLLGNQIASQTTELMGRLPEMISSLGDRLGVENLRGKIESQIEQISSRSGLFGKLAGYTTGVIGVLGHLLLVAAAGIYLAARPRVYRQGVLSLVPRRVREEVSSAFDNAGGALRQWLLGQLISMALVGILTTVGLYLIGMPSAMALGFLAGIGEFVPLVGPFLSAIPAILLALSEGGSMVLWVGGLYLAIQQVESNVIMPLVQRRTVDLPPVLPLFAVLSLGVLFGPLGILLGTPLAVLIYVAVKQLYLRDALGEKTDVPGEHQG